MKKGWTAIESLVVISIVGIIVAMAIPAVKHTVEADRNSKIRKEAELSKTVQKLVNESIMCFEMPEEELQPKPAEVQPQQPSPEYYVYYVSYFFDNRQGAAEIYMTRQITSWADLYTTEDSVISKVRIADPSIKSLIFIQFSLLKHIPAQ